MTLLRASGTAEVPVHLVRERLTRACGSPVSGGADRWRVDLACPYRADLALDPTDGDVVVTVDARVPYLPVAVGTAGPLVATVALRAPVGVLAPLAVACLLAAAVPLAPNLPGVPVTTPPLPEGVVLERTRVTPLAALPYAAFLGTAALFAPSALGRAATLVALVVGVAALARDPRPTSGLARQFPAVAVPLAALVPGLLAVLNLAGLVTARSLDAGGVRLLAVVLVGNAVVGLAVYAVLCRRALERLSRTRLRSVTSAGRLAWAALFLAANLVTLGGAALVTVGVVTGRWVGPAAPVGDALDALGSAVAPLPGVAWPYTGVTTLALGAPALLVVGGWLVHLGTTVRGRLRLRRAARPADADDLGFNPAVPVRLVESDRPFATALTRPLRGGVVVVSDRLAADLDPEELAAVCAHEAHHVRSRGRATGLSLSVVSVLFGGRNAVLVLLDYAAVERAADRRAASVAGVDATVRALRRVEAIAATAAAGPRGLTPGVGAARPDGDGALAGVGATLAAPYRLLFGGVVLDRAHGSVDERVAALQGADTGDAPGTATDA